MKTLLFILCLTASGLSAEEEIITLQSTITGNQEQPKVLSIVPWQQPPQAGDIFIPISSLIEADMQLLDRDVMLRQLDYHMRIKNNKTTETK